MKLHICFIVLGLLSDAGEALLAHQRLQSSYNAGQASSANKPHIMFILLDDLGWSEAGFNKEATVNMVPTPHMDALAADGVVLKRHYVHKYCGPSRAAIQSGRAPIHVTVQNNAIETHNPADPSGGFSGIPRDMTTIAKVLKGVGYKTHMVGKWDVGLATPEHSPAGRGYDTSLIYFEHENGYWDFKTEVKCGTYHDLWEHNESIKFPGRPAIEYMNKEGCSYENQEGCLYEDQLFEERVKGIIKNHQNRDPLFLFWATHAVHGPYEPPTEYRKRAQVFSRTSEARDWFKTRSNYYATLVFIDEAIGRVVTLLKDEGLYDNMFIVLSSDNGGVAGMSNEPLRGAKFTNYEGGIRAVSCVSGGILPNSVRGSIQHGLVGAQDWYATFAHLAGADPTDQRAAAANLPAVDSINVWPLLAGETNISPRQSFIIGTAMGGYDKYARKAGEPTAIGEVKRVGSTLYKLIIGDAPGHLLECGVIFGPGQPAFIDPNNKCPLETQVCGVTPATGCLFDLEADPKESKTLAAEKPVVFDELLKDIQDANPLVYKPNRGDVLDDDCHIMSNAFGGFLGPFAN